jgi:hypothetical protein
VTVWLQPTDVAAFLGLILDTPTQDRLTPVCAAAQAWVERTRPDLDYTVALPGDVYQGSVMYAAILFQSAASPTGMPTYDDLGNYQDPGASMGQVYRLVGARRPVVA